MMYVLGGLLLFGTACTTEVDGPDNSTNNNGTGNTTCEYLTYEVGTTLVFRTMGEIDTLRFTAEEEIDGQTWLKALDMNGAPSYQRCDGQFWYLHGDANGTTITLRAMKIDATAGDSWEDTETFNGLVATYSREVISVDGTREVEGTTYTDVAEVAITATVSGTVFSEYTEYLSRSAGFIETTLEGAERTLVSRSN